LNLLMDWFEQMLQRFLSTIPCCTLDRFACAAVNGNECSSKAIQGRAEEGQCSADPREGVWILLAKLGKRFTIWGALVQQPHELQVALACVCAFSTRAARVEGPREIPCQHRARMIGRPPRLGGCGLGKTSRLQIQPIDKGIKQTHRMCCI